MKLPTIIIRDVILELFKIFNSLDYLEFICDLIGQVCKEWRNVLPKVYFQSLVRIESLQDLKRLIKIRRNYRVTILAYQFNMNLSEVFNMSPENIDYVRIEIAPSVTQVQNNKHNNKIEELLEWFPNIRQLYLGVVYQNHINVLDKGFHSESSPYRHLLPKHLEELKLSIECSINSSMYNVFDNIYQLESLETLNIVSIVSSWNWRYEFRELPRQCRDISLNLTLITDQSLISLFKNNQHLSRFSIAVSNGSNNKLDLLLQYLPVDLEFISVSILNTQFPVQQSSLSEYLSLNKSLKQFSLNCLIAKLDPTISSSSKIPMRHQTNSVLSKYTIKESMNNHYLPEFLTGLKTLFVHYLSGSNQIMNQIQYHYITTLKKLFLIDTVLTCNNILLISETIKSSKCIQLLMIVEYPNSKSANGYFESAWTEFCQCLSQNSSLTQLYIDTYSTTSDVINCILGLKSHPSLVHFGCRYIKQLQQSYQSVFDAICTNSTLTSLNISTLFRFLKPQQNFDLLISAINGNSTLRHLNFRENSLPNQLDRFQLEKLNRTLLQSKMISIDLGSKFLLSNPRIYSTFKSKLISLDFMPNEKYNSFHLQASFDY
ncbi:hypothetical protein DLAC_06798 [Tieghemostelium lacteum]|uniref:Uncharacterized protein n=1 Tax=Tieghemostelium lacteum TaxID=361077 RepID=A0A151ZDE0_TIELA|nr:hypothetical protein DLAC_06798 [Tieghemostelium lacteum]|eukprot:KYQ91978.1 hypothetical protein DLAC_06798 [Tieghemostelium lacteum]